MKEAGAFDLNINNPTQLGAHGAATTAISQAHILHTVAGSSLVPQVTVKMRLCFQVERDPSVDQRSAAVELESALAR